MSPEGANPIMQFIPLILIFTIFYFLVIRPQQKKQKDIEQMQKNLQVNDNVVTISGIHGTIVTVKDRTVILKVDANTRIEFDREAVTAKKTS
ncbi:MAG: preprotein translocase subunit YajC [Candidatus Omnitrophica bacterium CG12_big_fil_rev_8_21_14_0_65_50_5]|nr:MAG: preprotein translocase subunit YajC [Candidatus Omnitrophica bacterium CG12_big_fil_rev_8_21_14_0_65_50_5]